MSVEAAVLGLLSAIRAAPLAAVYAFLLSGRPGRLLAGYLGAGLLVSLGVGIAVVGSFHATSSSSTSTATRQIIDLALGVAALSYAAGYRSGRVGGAPTRRRRGPLDPEGVLGRRLRTPSVPVAMLAGAVTNLPGLFYIAGLVAILETQPSPVNGVVQVVVYNVLRFAVPIAALVLVLRRPDHTRRAIEKAHAWGVRHKRILIVGVFGLAGIYLTIKGLLGLVG